MLRSIFAGLFAIVLTLGLGISSVSAKTVEVKLGTDAGMLAFEPSTVTISTGDTVKFVNNKLAPHNAVFDGHEELSHADLLLLQESLGKKHLILLELMITIASHIEALEW